MNAIKALYDCWCLDFDGTLLSVKDRYTQVHFSVVKELGGQPIDNYWALRRNGLSELDIIKKSRLPQAMESDYDRLRSHILESERYLQLDYLLPNAEQFLTQLRAANCDIWIVTHRVNIEGLTEQLEKLGIIKFLTGWYTTTQFCGTWNNHPLSIFGNTSRIVVTKSLILGTFKPNHDRVVMLGDSPTDIQAARDARIDSIALSTGMTSRNRLDEEMPTYAFSDLRHMLGYFRSNQTDV
jgi:phosphoglycolate phosphatase-like HAD superfamily hydrolase